MMPTEATQFNDNLPDYNSIEIHQFAVKTLADCDLQAAGIENVWREIDPMRGIAALTSLSHNVCHLFGKFFGEHAVITRDGELSLFVSHRDTSFVYGMIFHGAFYRDVGPTKDHSWSRIWRPVPRESVVCMYGGGADVDFAYCGKPYEAGTPPDYTAVPTCTGHTPDPYLVPTPGTWSFHS